jgi:hypothetical protein
MDGEVLRAVPDPAGAFLGDESPQDFATRVAEEQVEARRLPPVAAMLLGRTAGLLAGDLGLATPAAMPTPSARLVIALGTISAEAAETTASVIAERLATGRTPPLMGGDLADRPWVELFLQRTVHAISGDPTVLIELVPGPGVPGSIVQSMLFQRIPGFLAWDW